jgi:hypothetical protein
MRIPSQTHATTKRKNKNKKKKKKRKKKEDLLKWRGLGRRVPKSSKYADNDW